MNTADQRGYWMQPSLLQNGWIWTLLGANSKKKKKQSKLTKKLFFYGDIIYKTDRNTKHAQGALTMSIDRETNQSN